MTHSTLLELKLACFFCLQSSIKQLPVEDQTGTGGVTYYNTGTLNKLFCFFLFSYLSKTIVIIWYDGVSRRKTSCVMCIILTILTNAACCMCQNHTSHFKYKCRLLHLPTQHKQLVPLHHKI